MKSSPIYSIQMLNTINRPFPTRYKSHHDASRSLKRRYTMNISAEEYLEQILNQPAKSRRAIYIHVPFCTKVCSFCPFHRPDRLRRREYHRHLIAEMRRIRGFEYMKAPISAVYFGGGTPTALSPEQLELILEELHQSFNISPDAEISVETSATELTDDMLSALRRQGVNRLSVGVQTFDDDGRALLGRRGGGDFAYSRIERALEYGFVT